MKKILKHISLYFFGRKLLQPFFEALHFIGLKGMHYGTGSLLAYSGEKAAFELFLASTARSGLVIFDVGANKGEYTEMVLSVCRTKGRNVHVYAFEPSPAAFAELSEKFSGHAQVTLLNYGVGGEEAELQLYTDTAGSGLASLYNRDLRLYNIALIEESKVQVRTLDEVTQSLGIPYIDFLKLDIEGSELAALKGSCNLLADKKISWIQFEFGGTAIDAGIYFKDFFTLLSGQFSLYRVLRSGLRHMPIYRERWEIFMTSNFIARLR